MGLFGRKKKEETPFVTVVIAAAGASRRMGGENKQLILLDGIPVLGRTLLAFQQKDGGFTHVVDGGTNLMATEQAAYALAAYERVKNGEPRLFDMR